MASQLPEVIDEALLICPLCLKTQQDPKILPCLHIFCKKCIKDYVGKATNQTAERKVRGQTGGQTEGQQNGTSEKEEETGDELDMPVTSPEKTVTSPEETVTSPEKAETASCVKSITEETGDGSSEKPEKASDEHDAPVTSPPTSPVTSPSNTETSSAESPTVVTSRAPMPLPKVSTAPSLVTLPMTSQEETPTSPLPLLRPRSSSQENVLSAEDSVKMRQEAFKKRRSRSMDLLSDAATSCDADSGFCSEGQRGSLGTYVYPVCSPSPITESSNWPALRSPTHKSRQADSIYQDIETMDSVEPFSEENHPTSVLAPLSPLPFDDEPPPLLPKARRRHSEKPRRHSEKPKVPPKPNFPLKRWTVTKNSKRYKERPMPPVLTRVSSLNQKQNTNRESRPKLQTEISIAESTENEAPTTPQDAGETPSKIPCPVCQFQFKERDLNMDKLKSCQIISRLQDFVLTQTSGKKRCGNCESASASFHCFDCEQYLCSGCRDAHKWLKVTRDHKVLTFRELHHGNFHHKSSTVASCSLHPDAEATQFCATCDSLICDDCRLVAHPHHACAEISTVMKRDKDYLQQLLDSLEPKAQEFENTAKSHEDFEQQCMDERERLIVNITAQKERLYVAIEECFSELVEQITERYGEEVNVNSQLKAETQTVIDSIDHTKKLTNQLLRHGKDTDVVSMTTLLKERVQYLQEATPTERVSTMEMDFYPSFPDLLTTMPMFGRVVQRNIPVYTPTQPSPAKQRALWEEKRRRQSNQPTLLHSFKARTDQDTKGCKPTGLAILPNNHIALVDDINKKVKLLDPEGNLCREICPSGEHKLVDPWDVALTRSKTLVITDKGAKCVKEFTTNGDFVREFGTHLKSPWGIAVNSKGQIIVTDTVEKAVFVHNASGHLLYTVPTVKKKSAANRLKCPEYVAVNQNDDIIVSDFEKHCVFVFDALGRLLFKIGKKGQGLGDFCVPCGVTVDADQNILVCDYNNQRVSMMDRNGQFKCNLLNLNNHISMPQAVEVTREGYVVVADGATVKTFKVKETEKVVETDNVAEVSEKNLGIELDKYYNATYGTLLIDNPNNDKKIPRETSV